MKRHDGKVPKEKAVKFLKNMGHNEVEIVRKLKEAPTQVSILDMVLASEDHRRVLFKILKESHLSKTVDTEKFSYLIGHILDSNIISFIDDDIPAEGTGHRKPLHIAVILSRYILGGALIDGGSALNICPYDTLERMNINPNRIQNSNVVVRAFNRSRRDTVGEIALTSSTSPSKC